MTAATVIGPAAGRALPSRAPLVVLAGAVAVAAAARAAIGFRPWLLAASVAVVYAVAMTVWSGVVEGRRHAVDRLATTLVTGTFLVALVPLVSLVATVLVEGLPSLSLGFFTENMVGVLGEGGGIAHAAIGTLLIAGLATLVSVPVGLLTAIYLVEYGRGRLARSITFFVDVMTGIPSVVAGLFAYALFVIIFGPGVRMGAAGSAALSVLMIPVVVRSTEEILRVVPNELREASYALGVPKWLTIVKVVLPTAVAGIVAGVTIAIARVVGETAPLLLVAGITNTTNTNLFDGRMTTLPVYAYYQYVIPGVPPEVGQARAWSAALVLIAIVMALNLLGRFVSRAFSPKAVR